MSELSPARKAAIRRHDKFTAMVITPLVGLTFFAALFPSQPTHVTLTYAITLYLLADVVYHVLVPHCQPSGHRVATIMLHHALSLMMCAQSLLHPIHADICWRCTLVEANTLVHNANKVLRWRALNIAFYLSKTRPRPHAAPPAPPALLTHRAPRRSVGLAAPCVGSVRGDSPPPNDGRVGRRPTGALPPAVRSDGGRARGDLRAQLLLDRRGDTQHGAPRSKGTPGRLTRATSRACGRPAAGSRHAQESRMFDMYCTL